MICGQRAGAPSGSGGVNQQTVIRMNRDTLYSGAIVDISAGAQLTIPDTGRRYVSVMIVNHDHYINQVFHDPGAGRPGDISVVNALQHRSGLKAGSVLQFVPPDYDQASLDATAAG